MALIDIEKKYSFLADVELKELKNKTKDDVILKTIKFNKDEHILLKYITYIDKNFSSYIKQLIEKDISENLHTENKDININEEYLINLIEKVLNKNNDLSKDSNKINESKINKEMIDDLSFLGIKKR